MFPDASAYAITADSLGNVFVAGTAKEPSNLQHAIVMKSSDGGQTWDSDPSTPDVDDPSDVTVAPADFSYAGYHAITSARIGNGEEHLVAAGRDGRLRTSPTTLNGRWLIRRSTNAGATWTTLDQFTHPTYNMLPSTTGYWGVGVDNNGNIYAAGWATETIVSGKKTSYVNHWIIRKSSTTPEGNMEWKTIDLRCPAVSDYDRENCFPSAVACVGNKIFVVGGFGATWQVFKSVDSGTTWTVADSFRYDASDLSHAYGIAADSGGNLFVAGLGRARSGNTLKCSLVVRKGSPDGTSWTTVDQFKYPNGSGRAYGVTVDRNNDVHVTGSGWLATSTLQHWITRRRSAATGLWSTGDDFVYGSNASTLARAITADPLGNVFATGMATDSSGVPHNWLVRRKPAP